MNALYSLYDALVGINIPPDKAKAVVDALEQDMTTVLATKSDLTNTQLLLKQDIAHFHDSLKQDIASFNQSLKQEISGVNQSLKQEIANVNGSLRQEMTHRFDLLSERMETLRTSMRVELGAMLFGSMGLLFVALKLTS
jgi:uncharacterized protein YoxC